MSQTIEAAESASLKTKVIAKLECQCDSLYKLSLQLEVMLSTENTKKIIVIGDGCVGKTCLVAKLTEGKFINNYHVTIGGEYYCCMQHSDID